MCLISQYVTNRHINNHLVNGKYVYLHLKCDWISFLSSTVHSNMHPISSIFTFLQHTSTAPLAVRWPLQHSVWQLYRSSCSAFHTYKSALWLPHNTSNGWSTVKIGNFHISVWHGHCMAYELCRHEYGSVLSSYGDCQGSCDAYHTQIF